jgi:Tfp pilus assembly protein PilO
MKLKLNATIIWLSVGVIIAAGLVVFGFLPFSHQLKTQADTIIDKRNELSELQAQVQNFGKQQGVNELDNKQTELNRLLIPKKNILEFLSAVEDQARIAGVTDTISFSDFPTKSPNILEHPFSLAISGNYEGVVKFLRLLEGLDYYLNFNQFTITARDPGTKSTGLTTPNLSNSNSTVPETELVQLTIAGFAYWY